MASAPPVVRRVLLVDDEAVIRRLVLLLLSAEGCDFDEAADGWEAFRLILDACSHDRPYDAIVLNHLMPHLTGLGLLRLLQRVAISVPVVFYTAAAGRSLRDAARAAGAKRVLWTPLEPADMFAAVEEVLNGVDDSGEKPR